MLVNNYITHRQDRVIFLPWTEGPACTKMEQIKGEKVYFIRFLPPAERDRSQQPRVKGSNSAPISPSKIVEINGHHPETPSPKLARTVYPTSVSTGDLLRAGKLVRPPQLTLSVWKCLM